MQSLTTFQAFATLLALFTTTVHAIPNNAAELDSIPEEALLVDRGVDWVSTAQTPYRVKTHR